MAVMHTQTFISVFLPQFHSSKPLIWLSFLPDLTSRDKDAAGSSQVLTDLKIFLGQLLLPLQPLGPLGGMTWQGVSAEVECGGCGEL